MTDRWKDDGRTEINVALAHPKHGGWGVGGAEVVELRPVV